MIDLVTSPASLVTYHVDVTFDDVGSGAGDFVVDAPALYGYQPGVAGKADFFGTGILAGLTQAGFSFEQSMNFLNTRPFNIGASDPLTGRTFNVSIITQNGVPTSSTGFAELRLPHTGSVYGHATLTSGTASAAPEPAMWAMMIGGFGAIGFGLRRRKASVSFA